MGWSGEQGIRRGKRSTGMEDLEMGGVAENIKSKGKAPLKRPLK